MPAYTGPTPEGESRRPRLTSGAPMGESRRGQGPSRVKVSARRPHAPARLSAPWQFPVLGSVLGLKLTIPERSRTVGAGHTGRKPLALLGNKMVRTAGVRTRTGSPPQDFKSCVSTSSTTSAMTMAARISATSDLVGSVPVPEGRKDRCELQGAAHINVPWVT